MPDIINIPEFKIKDYIFRNYVPFDKLLYKTLPHSSKGKFKQIYFLYIQTYTYKLSHFVFPYHRKFHHQSVIPNIWCSNGFQCFQNSCNFRRTCDLHLSITPTALIRFNFPFTSTHLSFLFASFDVSLFLLLYLSSQSGGPMFRLTFLFPTILICNLSLWALILWIWEHFVISVDVS